MKTNIVILVLALSTSFFTLQAQRTVTTTRAASYDISDNLDLDAVASIFGDSKNLEDFERTLNDPDNRISNLDLNEDGYIDYLRVLENSTDRNSLVVIQAVLDQDVYQDVATIEIERVNSGNVRVQIVGDSYIYGSNYIIEPVYVRTPVIFSFFWSPRYVAYHSPYYWNYYPRWYSYYRPYPTYRYHRHVYSHINRHHIYNRTHDRNVHFSGDSYNQIRRSDYASRNPNRAFSNRNEGLRNKQELSERRVSSRQGNYDVQGSNRQSNTGRNERQRDVRQNNRMGSDVQSGSNQTRTRENRNIGTTGRRPNTSNGPVQMKSGSRDGQQNGVIQNRRQGSDVRSGSGESRTRESQNIENNQKRPDYNNGAVKIKSANRNEGSSVPRNREIRSPQQGSDSRNQSISRPAPERSSNRVESPQRSSAPREKSGSVSSGRSNHEVKQAQPNVRRSESGQREDKNESGNSRRR